MPQSRKTTEELIARELKKSEQAKARIAELKGQQRADERKRDSHRKIVVGAAVMAHIKIDPQFRKEVREALNKAITDPKHKAVIPDLLDEQAFHEAMRAAAKKADAEAKGEAEESAGEGNEPARPPQAGKSGPGALSPLDIRKKTTEKISRWFHRGVYFQLNARRATWACATCRLFARLFVYVRPEHSRASTRGTG